MANVDTIKATLDAQAKRIAELEAQNAQLKARPSGSTKAVSFTVKTGTSRNNGRPYKGINVSGPAWGYVGAGVFKAIVSNPDLAQAALAELEAAGS